MYGYVYEVTNKINGKKYIGRHSSPFINENYKGSGTLIVRAIRKYGWDNFDLAILEECDSFESLLEREAYWIDKFDCVNNDLYYNLCPGGEGFKKGMRFSDYHREAISEAMLGSKNHNYRKDPNINQREALEAGQRLPASEKLRERLSEIRTGIVVSDSTRALLSAQQLGRRCINDGIKMTYVKPEDLDEYLNNGWELGRIKTRKSND